jgi:putative ATP-binding cassette transporter
LPVLEFLKLMNQLAGSRRRTILIGGVVAGLLEGLTIAVIGMGLDDFANDKTVPVRVFLLFALCVIGYYVIFRLTMRACTEVAFNAVSDLQLRISDKLRQTAYMSFMSMERSEVYSALMGNKDIMIEASRFLVSFVSGVAMMFCAFCYAAFISLTGLLVIVGILVTCGMIFVSMHRQTIAQQEAARIRESEFLASLRHLLDGFTELKMNRAKSDDLYHNSIRALNQKAIAARQSMERTTIQATAFFTTFAYLPVGAVLFLLPKVISSVSTEQIIKLIAVTLFSLSPMMGLVLFIPLSTKAYMMYQGLTSFEAFLDSRGEPGPPRPPVAPAFERLEIKDASFTYEGPNPFSITVGDFHLNQGELVVLAGGNGSGKSTFMRVLAGLIPLSNGTIQVNGQPLGGMGLDDYRSLFSVIFTEFHLFDTLYGIKEPDLERLQGLLEMMKLTDKVTVTGRTFSTTELSSGQRKRLALICAMMEDRQIMLFDEVAADFDFHFRDFFYRTLLPELKAAGKTILAISHDDRYFHVADRVLTMHYGSFEPPASASPPACPVL